MEVKNIRYINEKEVKQLTGFALQTLRNNRCRGVGFPYRKIGRSVKYLLQDIIDFMEAHKIETSNSRV